MAQLYLQLLGGFAVALDQQPVTKFRSAKSRALLAYLATQPDRDHARTTLATLLWGDLPEDAAKTNLRIELSNLNKLLADHPALLIERNTVRFQRECAAVDVTNFQQMLTTFGALPVETQRREVGRLGAAVELYGGEFLNGFSVTDALAFDEWRVMTQEQLHEQAMGALTRLQQHYAENGCWGELVAVARRQLTLVPWQESAHRNLMQALAAQGQRDAALEQYARCVAVLQRELGVEPAPATKEIAARLRKNGAADNNATPAVIRHNLPQQSKTLVGRKAEIGQVYDLVQQERLVTLLGLGGVGKSRLAQAVAQKALHDFADGVWFVSLAQIEAIDNAPDRIALAMAAAIGFPLTNVQQPLAELAAHLAKKEILFVLDNWDQLTAAAETLCEHLLATQAVHLLATSRVRLQVEGEIVVGVEGLPAKAAFTLFVERARQVTPTFDAEAQRTAIDSFCAQVAGLPLGIELAASWVEHFTVAEIGHSLTEIVIEPAQGDGYVNRHQTLNALFEYSWRLLSPAQQTILARLSAFLGGFDRAAGSAVADSNLSDLSLLIAHSLVQRVAAGRYDLHPLVQEFAAGKLALTAAPRLYGAHAAYYLPLLASTESTKYATLQIDFANIRTSWQRAVEAANGALIEPQVTAFGEFIMRFGGMADGNRLFAAAADTFAENPAAGNPAQAELVAQLLDQQARFVRALHGLPALAPLQQRVLTLTQKPKLQANAHFDLANHYAEQGEWAQADFHFDQTEALAQASSDLGFYIGAVEERIYINTLHFRGDFAQAIAQLEAMVQLLDTATTPVTDADNLRLRLLRALAMVAMRYRDYGAATHYATLALACTRQIAHRYHECSCLLDLALAEQFAGLFADAVSHNQAALAIAEAIGDTDTIALLKANLCLTLRQQGELTAALDDGLAAVASLRTLGNRRIEGQARNRLGHTLLALARWAEAATAYGEALTVWAPTQHPNRYEAVAGRAVALYHLGQHAEALALVQEVLTFVATADLVGIVEPVLLLLNCATVLTDCGEGAAAQQTLQRADDWVQLVAGRIRDNTVRTAFLARPDVRQLVARMC
jgi:DNA-binding SARP family transcriptional activator